jgi:hypothetical protein
MSSVRPVESFTETDLSEGTSERAMMPFTAAADELEPALEGALEARAAELGAVDPVAVFEPPELPQAASKATPPAPAPSKS